MHELSREALENLVYEQEIKDVRSGKLVRVNVSQMEIAEFFPDSYSSFLEEQELYLQSANVPGFVFKLKTKHRREIPDPANDREAFSGPQATAWRESDLKELNQLLERQS